MGKGRSQFGFPEPFERRRTGPGRLTAFRLRRGSSPCSLRWPRTRSSSNARPSSPKPPFADSIRSSGSCLSSIQDANASTRSPLVAKPRRSRRPRAAGCGSCRAPRRRRRESTSRRLEISRRIPAGLDARHARVDRSVPATTGSQQGRSLSLIDLDQGVLDPGRVPFDQANLEVLEGRRRRLRPARAMGLGERSCSLAHGLSSQLAHRSRISPR